MRAPSDAADLPNAALVVDAPPVTTVTDGAAQVATMQDSEVADKLFYDGKSLSAAGYVDLACLQFETSLQLLDRMGVRLNLADCHEKQGRTATAWNEFRDAAMQADNHGDSRATYARLRANALVRHLAKLALLVPPASQLPGLVVEHDGIAVPSEAFEHPILVDPGGHTVEVSALGYQSWRTYVEVTKAGEVVTVKVPRLAAALTKDVAR